VTNNNNKPDRMGTNRMFLLALGSFLGTIIMDRLIHAVRKKKV